MFLLGGDEVVAVVQPHSLGDGVFDQLDPVAEVHLLVAVPLPGRLVLHLLEEDGEVELVGDVPLHLQQHHPAVGLHRLHGSDLEVPSLCTQDSPTTGGVPNVDVVGGGWQKRNPHSQELLHHRRPFLNVSSADLLCCLRPVRKTSRTVSDS